MEINELSGSAVDKMRHILKEALGETAEKVQVESTGKGVTITYAVKGEATPVSFTIDLEEAEDGSIIFDPVQLAALQEKLAKDLDIDLDFSYLSDDVIRDAVQSSIDEFEKKYGDKMFTNTYLCIFAILRILQDSADKLKKAAIAARMAAMDAAIQAINNQARQELSNAITGAITAGLVCAVQITITIIASKLQIKAVNEQGKQINNDPTVKLKNEIAANTRLLSKPEAANTAMQKAAEGLPKGRAEAIMKDLGGYTGKEPIPLSDRSKLDKTIQRMPVKPKDDAPGGKLESKEVLQRKEKYVQKLDRGVDSYRTKYENAKNEYDHALKKDNPSKEELAGLKEKVETARQEYVFANATRTAALANGPGGKPLIDESRCDKRIAMAEHEVDAAEAAVSYGATGQDLKKTSLKADMRAKVLDVVNNLLGNLPQLIQQILHGDIVLREGDRQQADKEYEQVQNLLGSIDENRKKVAVMFEKVTQSNLDGAKQVFQG